MSTATIETNTSLVTRTDLFRVPASKLKTIEGFNIRQDYGNIAELTESIRENGVKVPLRGYKDKDGSFIVVDGHRRYQAVKALLEQGVEVNVPFILEAKKYSDEQRLIDMFVMNEGKALTTLEQAEGVRRFIAYGYNEKDIAAKLAKSEGYIRKLNSLNTAPKKFIDLIRKGTISGTYAIEVIAKGQVDEVLNKAAEKVVPEDTAIEAHTSTDGQEIKETVPKSGGKITKKEMNVNSFAEFKKYMKRASEEDMMPDVLVAYQFAVKLANNELTALQIQQYFG